MFSETLEELLEELNSLPFPWEIYWAHEKSLPQCFNDPTEEALKDPDVFAVLFCEDDMILPEGILMDMFEERYPVVALDYPFRQNGDSTCLHDPDGMAFWTGTGFLLVAKPVLENMEKPIWRTDTTYEQFIDSDTMHWWPRKLNKVFYGLHDLRFGLICHSSGMPIKPMQKTAGQRKLKELGKAGSNNGAHKIDLLTEVGRDVVSGKVDVSNVEVLHGALNRVEKVKYWDDIPPFISYDDDDQPYLNDGRVFDRVR